MENDLDKEKQLAAVEAVKFVENGMVVGLGTGSTANFAIREIGKMISDGLWITGVATSNATEELACSLEIPLKLLDDVESIDLTIDGTDEFDADLNLIKGGGGALFREKMVAKLSKREIIIADSTKQVEKLGAFRVPVEVVPIALSFAEKQIEKFGGKAELRMRNGEAFITDAGNRILDADFGLIEDVRKVSANLDSIEGVVCHGLFIDLADTVILASGEETRLFEKPRM